MADKFDAVKGVDILEALAKDEMAWIESYLAQAKESVNVPIEEFLQHMRVIKSVLGAQIAMNIMLKQNLLSIDSRLEKIWEINHAMAIELGVVPNQETDSVEEPLPENTVGYPEETPQN